MADPDAVVVCRQLAKRFGERVALHGLDLAIRRGEVFGLVGANGGAKTTTLRLIAGLLRPDGGTCTIFGAVPGTQRHRIGLVPQRAGLHPTITVRETLEARAGLAGMRRVRAVAGDAIRRFGLAEHAGTRAQHLSGGWARRVQLAGALIHGPDLVLLDEPTVGLDVAARQEIWRHILALRDSGTTVIVSTHDMVEAERFDRIVFLAGGRTQAIGRPADIIAAIGVRCAVVPSGACLDGPAPVASYPSPGGIRLVFRDHPPRSLDDFAAPPTLEDAALALLAGGQCP